MDKLRQAANALIKHWEAGEYKNCTGYMAGHIADLKEALRQALAQPKREWVGLTPHEVYVCWKSGDVVAAVEAKLKEKNT